MPKMQMRVRFWGVRGSIACPGPSTIRYGGNTPCIEVRCGGHVLIFDAGTGLRPLGIELVKDSRINEVDIFITHCHLDHVVGLPFFAPLFRSGFRVRVWAANLRPANSIERVMRMLMSSPLFPVQIEVFKAAKAEGLVCSYVSNGNGTEEVLEYIRPWVRLYKVDLKGFRDRPYRDLGGTLERVLATIRSLHEKGFWVEIVTLVVPGFNDSPEELRDIARFLVSVSPDVPWHVTAFHPDYKMDDRQSTSVSALLRAAEIGAAEGLNFVYAGNLPGSVRSFENTYCPGCRALLVERVGYRILENRLGASGRCPECQRSIPGVWAI